MQNADYLLRFIKQQTDALMAKDEKLQQYYEAKQLLVQEGRRLEAVVRQAHQPGSKGRKLVQ